MAKKTFGQKQIVTKLRQVTWIKVNFPIKRHCCSSATSWICSAFQGSGSIRPTASLTSALVYQIWPKLS